MVNGDRVLVRFGVGNGTFGAEVFSGLSAHLHGLGGNGSVGEIAANVEYYNPVTGQWQGMVGIVLTAVSTDAVGVTATKIISVTSSEPDNGLGDGDTAGDFVITGPMSVNLRAERAGKGNGRTYTITVESRDAAGNVSTRTCTVLVPKSQGK